MSKTQDSSAAMMSAVGQPTTIHFPNRSSQGSFHLARAARDFVQGIFQKFGYRVINLEHEARRASGLDSFFFALKKRGFAPRRIFDVGANRGFWTRTAMKYFPDASYVLVEPQERLREGVQDLIDGGRKIEWIHAGTGDRSGMLPFTFASREDSCSFVPTQEQANSVGFERREIRVVTLNELVAKSGAPAPDLVKIDAEGFDLKVLAGASELLGKTEVFLAEAVVCSQGYENTVAEVVAKMASAGYRLVDITDLNRSPVHGVLWLCEVAFLREDSQLFEGIESFE
jgi:FkbM family methyltransferase